MCDKGISTPIRAKSAFQTLINLKIEQLSAANQGQHIHGFLEMTAPLSCTGCDWYKSNLQIPIARNSSTQTQLLVMGSKVCYHKHLFFFLLQTCIFTCLVLFKLSEDFKTLSTSYSIKTPGESAFNPLCLSFYMYIGSSRYL